MCRPDPFRACVRSLPTSVSSCLAQSRANVDRSRGGRASSARRTAQHVERTTKRIRCTTQPHLDERGALREDDESNAHQAHHSLNSSASQAGAQLPPFLSPACSSLTFPPRVRRAGPAQWAAMDRCAPSPRLPAHFPRSPRPPSSSMRPAMASAARTALPPRRRVLRAASAGDVFASGGHGGLPYVLKQRDGSGGAFDGSGGRHGAWLSP